MADRSLQPGSVSQSSLSDTQSTSEKSYNGNDASRSPSKVRGVDELQQPERSISFDSRFTQDDKKDDSSPSNSPHNRRMPNEIETPTGPVRRDTLHSLTALSSHTEPADRPTNMESKWPTDPRAWLCLLGGHLLMFNSWGIVNAYGTYASYYTQTLFDGQDILRMNLLGSTECFMILILSAPVGRFLDAGHTRMLIITGTILVSLGSFLLSAANAGGEGRYGLTWFTQGFITGLGMACFFVTSSQGTH